MAEQRQTKTEDEARQGVTGHGVRYVLSFGLGLVIIAFIVAYAIVRP
ncbi:MAG: hypothetical protein JO055_12915 [Alphaproteobacteria bacterium]|nr:hypothetical protein [Alphaproteobacteria bacterium]